MNPIRHIIRYIFPTAVLRNSPTVRYAFSFLFLFAALIGMAAVVSKDGTYIKIITPQSSFEAGSVFPVDVYVYANAPVNAVDISISFPEKQIEILGIDKGESVITLWTEDPFVAGDTVVLRGGTYKRGFVGEHKIATINAKALTAGKAEFIANNVKILAGDGKGTEIPTDLSRGKLITTITEPGVGTTIQGEGVIVVITDIDSDGQVTLTDISSFMASWASKDKVYDFNGDGSMTFRDFSIILADFFLK
jgi:hypothetical protein